MKKTREKKKKGKKSRCIYNKKHILIAKSSGKKASNPPPHDWLIAKLTVLSWVSARTFTATATTTTTHIRTLFFVFVCVCVSWFPFLVNIQMMNVLLHTQITSTFASSIVCCFYFFCCCFLFRLFVWLLFRVSQNNIHFARSNCYCDWGTQTLIDTNMIPFIFHQFSDDINRLHLNKFIWRMLQVSLTLLRCRLIEKFHKPAQHLQTFLQWDRISSCLL